MGAYLVDHPGRLTQYSARTNWRPSRPTGLTVLHTTEFPPVWTAEAQAAWIARRSDPGSYHDVADSYGDDEHLVPYPLGAWQDGTGSNGMALSVAFICRTTDWRSMTPADRKAILRAGARCFARQQAWLKANGYPTTPLRLITKAQSDAGQAGFIYHGVRDPGRRTDPGTDPGTPFPFNEFIAECRAVMAGEEDDMPLTRDDVIDIWAFRYPSPVSAQKPPVKVAMAVMLSASLLHAAKGREAAEKALAIATEQAKAGRALTVEEIERIAARSAELTTARVAKEVAESIEQGYEVRLEPKAPAA
jgi:hypothetical protein